MKRFPSRNSESIMPFKDHMDARKNYKGSPLTKFAEAPDGSPEHYKQRARIADAMKPFIERLRDNKFLGGDKISFSDCHFCQQLGNGRQLVEYLKKIDVIEENEILRGYWDRLTKMKSFRIGRGSYAIRTAKADVYEVERQYSKQLAEWCRDKWNLNFPNLQKVIAEDVKKTGKSTVSNSGKGNANGNAEDAAAKNEAEERMKKAMELASAQRTVVSNSMAHISTPQRTNPPPQASTPGVAVEDVEKMMQKLQENLTRQFEARQAEKERQARMESERRMAQVHEEMQRRLENEVSNQRKRMFEYEDMQSKLKEELNRAQELNKRLASTPQQHLPPRHDSIGNGGYTTPQAQGSNRRRSNSGSRMSIQEQLMMQQQKSKWRNKPGKMH